LLSPSRNSKAIASRIQTALEKAKFLLRGNETEIPKGVVNSLTFFANKNIWYKLSRNPVVKSCKEAANQRIRLGHKGIPLADELKTYLATLKYKDKSKRIVLIHCRADRGIDFDKITALLPDVKKIRRVGEKDLEKINSKGYGLINPFDLQLDDEGQTVLQVFDLELVSLKNITNTMMTNAGDYTWAVEFRPNELVKVLRRDSGCIVSDIIEKKELSELECPKSIGIIAGNPPEAAWLLWKKIENNIKQEARNYFLGDISLPKVIISSVPETGLSMELEDRHEQLWTVLKKNIEDLINQNVEIIAIACHTMQYYSDDVKKLCKNKGVEYVSIPDILCEWLKNSSIDNAALLGIGYSAQLGKWSGYKKLAKIIDIDEMPEPMLNRITTLAYDVKANVGRREFQKLERIIKDIDSENIIYLLFELSILAEHFSLSKNFHKHYIIDAVDIYAKALASKIMGKKSVEW
jgi:aspartate/glutamate racemase